MRGFTLTREMQIPKGATKVCDKLSDAVAYLYPNASNEKPAAMLFFGKQSKPVWRFYFSDEAKRQAKIAEGFASRQRHDARIAERRATPSDTSNRNKRLKQVVSELFPHYSIRVHGHRGTAYGWVTVKIGYTPKDLDERRALEAKVWDAINAAKIHIGTYGYDDPGSDYGYGRTIHINFVR